MKTNKEITGHLAAFITIIIWGTTFISTKVLLNNFTPIEILLFRFAIGYLALLVVFPHKLKGTNIKQEFIFACAGLCGVTLYFLMENIALTYTLASNVGIIVSVSPFFTALLSHLFLENEKLKSSFIVGFIIAMLGITLINLNGSFVLELNPIGDLLTILAALVWAIYSILTRKISQFGYNTIQTTRRTFFYGIIFMLPTLLVFPFEWGLERFINPVHIFNILFLGLGASALCFVSWNTAVKLLGAVKTSIYIYIVPAVTIITSILILNETITLVSICGSLLTLAGLFISERKMKSKKELYNENASNEMCNDYR